MDLSFGLSSPALLLAAIAVTLLAGFVKGAVGFAMPMIMISGLSTFLPPELALAALILPTLVTNGVQALRQGHAAAWASVRRFRIYLIAGFVALLISAQLVRVLPQGVLFGLIGGPIAAFTGMQLLGWRPHLARPIPAVEAAVGALSGFIGGLSGVWGPPTVAYLTAIDTPKADHVRIQGVIYGLGAVALLGAHVGSGVMRAATLPLSLLMILPAMAGMAVGLRLHDRLEQATFRRVTLLVLFVAALNLVRRAVF
ncbi:MAG: TSUP family transporter [Limimaricola sp.]|uniref:sulfite exporter TauE/SafE family protein n=1 Tax=Limimaricola sp. TaxID=2211665 RepID=UPI001DAB6252|nr:sulfite exporter TauE/SafE family protein [Limimaricola sp.]MBI1418639.1 TSUP family transporter [Limimaricola sp.]